jgi:hypothetical protein
MREVDGCVIDCGYELGFCRCFVVLKRGKSKHGVKNLPIYQQKLDRGNEFLGLVFFHQGDGRFDKGTGVGVLVRNFCHAEATGGVTVACLQATWYLCPLGFLLVGGVLRRC